MKMLSVRGRKVLRMIFRGISVSVASLILQACYGVLEPDPGYAEYGMPPPEYIQEDSINGIVQARETGEPIFGIKVSIEGTEYWERTGKDGYFYLRVPVQDVYKIKFEDVDGPYNGGLFREQTWTIKQTDTYKTLLMGMDLDI